MNWLAILLSFQIGLVSNGMAITDMDETASIESPQGAFFVDIAPEILLWNTLSISGFMKSYQFYAQSIYFAPYRIDYGFNANISMRGLELGFSHECDHPIIYDNDYATQSMYVSMNTSIYVKYSFKYTP